MIRIGVLGVGHLGSIHVKCIRQLSEYQLVGFYDPDERRAAKMSEEFGLKAFPSAESLIEAVDVVDIVAPTVAHFDLARTAMEKNRHVFIEKPIVHTLKEAEALVQLQEQHPVKIQVGHVERFNPAYLALESVPLSPMFIEAHRLAMFNPRGTDVSVVLDLMIHDLDIVLAMVKSEVTAISASGVAVVSDTPDIANARIEFENGCVANLTASRMSMKQMRKLRLFQPDAYISMDFLAKQTDIIRLYDEGDEAIPKDAHLMELETQKGKKLIEMSRPEVLPVNAIKMELETFAKSIVEDVPTKVSLQDGIKALSIAHQVIMEIEKRNLRTLGGV